MKYFMQGIAEAFSFMIALLFALGLLGFVTLALWNYLMPYIFGLPHINFTQAVGLNILSYILLGRDFSFSRPVVITDEGDDD